jgi:phage FluMu protein Com
MSEDTERSIYFFCRECQKIVLNPKKKGASYEYSCPECKKDNVAFGTKAAICDYFHIKDAMFKKMMDEQ